jgi:hypothetical protein
MSTQETPPGKWQPKLVEEEVNHNGNQLVHRAVVTLGPSFRKIRRQLGPADALHDRFARQFAETRSLPVSPLRPHVSLRLVSVTISEQLEDGDVPGGC